MDDKWNAQSGQQASYPWQIRNLDAKEKGARETTLDLYADSSTKAFDLPKVDDLTKTYFLQLKLHDAVGKLVSDNFYWLSTKLDTLDWKHKKDTVYTPQAEFADLTGLNALPPAKIVVAKQALGKTGRNNWMTLTIENKGEGVAFMVHPRVTKGKGGQDVTPIFWSDNYFSLLPGEKRSLKANYDDSALVGKEPVLEIDGYNIVPGSVPVGAFTVAGEN